VGAGVLKPFTKYKLELFRELHHQVKDTVMFSVLSGHAAAR
jgi:hypothetical protein